MSTGRESTAWSATQLVEPPARDGEALREPSVVHHERVLTWFRNYDHRTARFAIELDDGETITDGYFGVVSNTTPYTFLGSRPIHMRAKPDSTFPSRSRLSHIGRVDTCWPRRRLSGSGRYIRRHPRSRAAPRCAHDESPATARSRTRSTATISVTSNKLRITYEPDGLTIVMPSGTATIVMPSARAGCRPGRCDDGVDPAGCEPTAELGSSTVHTRPRVRARCLDHRSSLTISGFGVHASNPRAAALRPRRDTSSPPAPRAARPRSRDRRAGPVGARRG